MKRVAPLVAAVAGVVALLLVLPFYRPAEPRGISITRSEARRIANDAAQKLGIPLGSTWATNIWHPSRYLEKELRNSPHLADAWNDPVLGPRLNAYQLTYYYLNKDKYPPHGAVQVDARTGEVTEARLRLRDGDPGAKATEAQLRPRADAFVRSRTFAGAPSPKFESARPTVLRSRTDWVFRYRVPSSFPLPQLALYLNVYFVGDRQAGWDLSEEYVDGAQLTGDTGGDVASVLLQFATLFLLLLILIVIFLRKYHAGEVGVNTGAFLFAVLIVLLIGGALLARVSMADGWGLGSLDAPAISWAVTAFGFLLGNLPSAILLFLAWAVGESYARERWGEKLAAFDAILRRDPLNATVGQSLLRGSLLAPAVAGAALAVGAIPIALQQGWATATTGGTSAILYSGGPLYALVQAACEALLVTVGGVLFVLAWSHRRRVLWLGVLAMLVLGVIAGAIAPPIEPVNARMLFGFGGIAVVIITFLAYDLLTATTALFGGSLATLVLPLLSVARGELARELTIVLALPILGLIAFAISALLTRREVVYTYEDLAPHVKRIVERERVKAEIDAANRIQAALLPLDAPSLAGATVASHYRAATEIGGDYFDFLPLPSGEIGIAFGDVSGHGLTSGIVMAMAKAALMVQVDYDPAPRAVLDVLNEIVQKTAPKRMLMTFFFGVLDPHAQTLRFSSAGHLDPYVYRAATAKTEALSSWGFPLGVRRREAFREHRVEFAPGDRLVLYSDGLIEAIDDDGEPFGFERFEETIVKAGRASADEMKKALLTAVRKFTRNRPPEDDQTLVVVAFEELAADVLPREPHISEAVVMETVH
ncbi:MAG: SpoIIE family protein phosphatase [Acidobacteria bacterium]|nr:SpoIIE family protein phosphatase [Acidobacteriota bacterium]MBV9477140.1 SpoIIE family protein phosphatase [Acidobacteriota bacterium]